MAKKAAVKKKVRKPEKVNKSQLIRDQLAKTPNASPKEIAAAVGHGVTGQVVSVTKSKMKKNTGPATKRGRRKKTASGGGNLDTAISFVEAAGGLPAAKALIEQIERIKSL